MQHFTYQDTTFHTTPYSTSHILHFNHTMSEMATFTSHHISHTLTSHHISHQITPRHHISAHHSTSFPHRTPSMSPHSNRNFTSHYPTAPHIPHCISTIIPHHTAMCLIWHRQTIPHLPHFTSPQHTTIFHMYHTIVPHRITTFLI